MSSETGTIRERVKLPPSQTMIDSHYKARVGSQIKYAFEIDIWIHLVHVRMLEKQEIVSTSDFKEICRVLLDLQKAGPDALSIDYTIEDLYSYTERYLRKTAGADAGGKLHTGRSRNDLSVTRARMVLRGLMLSVLSELGELREVLLRLAEKHTETVMPGYTHWQHAQPITLGYYLLSFADQLQRDWQRCRASLISTNKSPLGAGALAGTAFPLDRHFTAEALGFDGLIEVAYDAVSSRDDGHEAVSSIAIMMTAISRLAVDLQAWSTFEYGIVELGDQHSSVSSIMPQKKNPTSLEHIKAEVSRVQGALISVLSSSKNTAFADVSDGVTGVDVPAWEAAERTVGALRLLSDVLENITVYPDRMLHLAKIGFGTATELADVIVRETGISFRKAHGIVALVVADALDQGRSADQISMEDIERVSKEVLSAKLQLNAEIMVSALDPLQNVVRRSIVGGPAPKTVEAMVGQRQAALDRDKEEIAKLDADIRNKRETAFSDARRMLA